MPGPAVPLIAVGVIALIAMMGGSKSTTPSKTPDQIKTDAYNQGVFDGGNACAMKDASGPSTAIATKTGNAQAYKDGYASGYAAACAGGDTVSYVCITPDAGMTLAGAQIAYVKLGYKIADPGGICGTSTIAATKSFQGSNGLPVTGIIDKATGAKLAAKASAGDTTYSEGLTDDNGISWTITNPASGTYRGVPTGDYPLVYNGKRCEAPSIGAVKSCIGDFATSVAGYIATSGRRGARGRPHTPVVGAQPMSGRPLGDGRFPSYSMYM